MVSWEYYTSVNSLEKAYIIFRFPGRFLFPTQYTLRGRYDWYYQKKWTVHGYNSGEENDSSKWTLLGNNESTADTFCGNGPTCNSNNNPTTFSLIPTNKGFEYIRFQTTESYSSSNVYFITSATEFFGTLSKTNKLKVIKNKVSVYRMCTLRESLLFMRLLTSLIVSR